MLKLIKHDLVDNKYSLRREGGEEEDTNIIFLKSIHESCLLSGSSIHGNTISFYASSIQTLKDFCFTPFSISNADKVDGNELKGNVRKKCSYNTAIHLVCSLSKQQQYLEHYGYSFYGIHLSDILVIDGCRFANINFEMCKEIDLVSSSITLYSPFTRSERGFFSPEMLATRHLPASIHYKTYYYSLGLLSLHCLFGECLDCVIVDILKPIVGTKLYFFILRMLETNPEERQMIFV
jgi:hypothetical protein